MAQYGHPWAYVRLEKWKEREIKVLELETQQGGKDLACKIKFTGACDM